jgi:peptidoglycan hydrolase FlgJ
MIVTPTPDLVLDVLQAADPVTQRAATAKLDALKVPGADFGAALDMQVGGALASSSVADDRSSAKTTQVEQGALANAAAPARVINATSPGDVYRKFEAFVLQVFVETMLPKNAEDIFGKGTAGTIWRSMMAEQLGNQLAQGKGIGIAKQLAGAHLARHDESGKAG